MFIKGRIPWNKGKTGYSTGRKGQKHTKETKNKIGERLKGRKPVKFWTGKHFSKEHRKNIGTGNLNRYFKNPRLKTEISEKLRGDKSHLWQGGKSYEIYSIDWTETLRRSIRERDHYTCQRCGKLQSDKAFDVHHVDGNKKNCNPDNLITLCRKCHIRITYDNKGRKNKLKIN